MQGSSLISDIDRSFSVTTATADLSDLNTYYRVSLAVGHKDADGNDLHPRILQSGLDQLERIIVAIADATSAIRQEGTLKALDGSLTKEHSTLLWAYCQEPPCVPCLEREIAPVASILKQNSILLSVETLSGIWIFVRPLPKECNEHNEEYLLE
jgi:hypothetical protein